jgi:hypothetical protein
MCSARCRCLASAEEVKIPPGRRGVLWGPGETTSLSPFPKLSHGEDAMALAAGHALPSHPRHGFKGEGPCVGEPFDSITPDPGTWALSRRPSILKTSIYVIPPGNQGDLGGFFIFRAIHTTCGSTCAASRPHLRHQRHDLYECLTIKSRPHADLPRQSFVQQSERLEGCPAAKGYPTTLCRQMKRRFHRRKYGQRWQAESAFSRHKRLLGPALRGRSESSRADECRLRVLTHNLMLLAAVT